MPDLHRRVGYYPGTFDPVTLGHLDVIERAARMVDRLVVGVAENIGKNPLLSLEERVAGVRSEVAGIAQRIGTSIEVQPFNALLVDAVQQAGATLIFRGLRVITDFDYEIQMTGVNRRLAPDIETVFLMASERTQFISSRFVKEIAKFGGDISDFVPPGIQALLLARLSK